MDCLSSAPLYQSFFEDYLVRNRPCLIDIDLTSEWPAHSRWTRRRPQSSSRDRDAPLREPDWSYLVEQYGQLVVPVVITPFDEDLESRRVEKRFEEVVKAWTEKGERKERWYVKDWHLAAQLEARGGRPFYSTPDIFKDDWLNAFYTAQKGDDFRFVYMGEQGTVTPLHRDVYASNSWSTNVLGSKLWTLFPPSSAPSLRAGGSSSSAAELIPDVRRLAGPVVDPELDKRFPKWREAWRERIEVVQQEGETIFIPSGWHHQVENLSPFVLSINHNWSNSASFPPLYASHLEAVCSAEEALSDVEELLVQRYARRHDGTGEEEGKGEVGEDEREAGWEHEWVKCVTDLVRADSGWDWETLWSCVLYAVSAYTSESALSHPNGSSHPPTTASDTENISASDPVPSSTLASASHDPASTPFPLPPPTLRPPLGYVASQVLPSLDHFSSTRIELRLSPAIQGLVREVRGALVDHARSE